MPITAIDHIVIPVTDLDKSIDFYSKVLGFSLESENDEKTFATLRAGNQLVKLETPQRQTDLLAKEPAPGSVDICFQSTDTPAQTIAHLKSLGVPLVTGPVEKHGVHGAMTSVYIRDLDGSLIEISYYA